MDPEANAESAPTSAPYPSGHFAHVVAAVRELEHPREIGPYAIQQLIGEGGMGAVYRAEQRTPIHRIVAIKVIKLGMDTREVIARFESERQALALMNHPNVAKVLDAGATETGRPYFVMEHVQGEPITHFADRHRLSIRQRLELFTQACEAIQHAHQKAIIHRDLKPSNILVTLVDDKPQVKVIDFGVAKAIAQKLTERTLFTETGQLVGTPEYMAPEQAEASLLDVDTRSDVYSLGVVLYELLTGALPFDSQTLRSAGYNEIQRIIREVDPPRPSTRLSKLGKGADEIAHLRQTPRELLQRQLRGELEWIPLKAMRKDRVERYASANDFADDIRNYLENRPLRAGPESASYRLRKFVRRNRAGVAASAAMGLLLFAGIIATSWQAIRATRAEHSTRRALLQVDEQRKQAEAARATAQAVNDFLTQDMIGAADPSRTRGRKVTVFEALDAAADSVELKFKDQPLLESAVRDALASTFDALGESDRALPHARRALEQRRRLLGDDDPQTLAAANTLVHVLDSVGDLAQAQRLATETLERARRVLGAEHEVTLAILDTAAQVLHRQNRLDEAEALYRESLELNRRRFGDAHQETLIARHNLASVIQSQQRHAEAEAMFRQLIVDQRAVFGDDHPHTINTITNLGMTLMEQGRLEEAEALCREALDANRRVLGENHLRTILSIRNLAEVLKERDQLDEAEVMFRDALARTERLLDADHIETIGALNNLGSVLRRKGDFEAALEINQQVAERCHRSLGPDNAYTVMALHNVGVTLDRLDRSAEAEPVFAEVFRNAPRSTLDPVRTAVVMAHWGPCLVRLGRFAEAEAPLREAYERLKSTGQTRGPVLADVVEGMAILLEKTGRPDEAARFRAELETITQPGTQPATQPT